ncbi:MAG: hypothetical protein AAGE80_04160 [Pseudomonadota bacterium]
MWKSCLIAAAAVILSGGLAQAVTVDLTIGGPNLPTIFVDVFGDDDLTVTAGSEVTGATPNVVTNATEGLGVSGFPEGRRIAAQNSTGAVEFLTLDFGQLVRVTAIEIFSTDGDAQNFSFGTVLPTESSVDLATPVVANNDDTFTTFAVNLVGTQFRLTGTEPNGPGARGVLISGITVEQIPVPGALILFVTGIAGLGFAARRGRKAA